MTPLQSQLEADLLRDPDDRLTHMAYGDYLAERGDPRGELIQVQLALEAPQCTPEQRRDLSQRESDLLDRHWSSFLGPLADYIVDRNSLDNRVTFRRGWVDSIRVGLLDRGLARALVEMPNRQLLRSLRLIRILSNRCEGRPDPREALGELAKLTNVPRLRSLSLGDHEGDGGMRAFGFPEVGEFLRCFAWVEELNLNVTHAEDQLRSLSLPSLKILRLDQFRLGDEGLTELLQSPWFTQLRSLQIWNARITDFGAAHLAFHPHTPQLDLLDLSFNWLSEAGIERLNSVCNAFRAEYQLSAETDLENLADQPDLPEGD
ncbi:MAG: TIGR02996 domain-containing protein [Gemmataceae bacterium]